MQSAQASPFFPHSPSAVPALHWPCTSQQPDGQLVASQTQLPPKHRWPSPPSVPQIGPLLQAQAPAVQRSDLASQLPQFVPLGPQLAVVWLAAPRQAAPLLQHPVRQEAGVQLQLPPWQTRPGPQALPDPHLQTPPVQVLVLPEHGAHA